MIIVVSSDHVSRRRFARVLTSHGFDVVQCMNGAQALDLISPNIEAVCIAKDLADANVSDLIEHIARDSQNLVNKNSHNHNIPIILLSNIASEISNQVDITARIAMTLPIRGDASFIIQKLQHVISLSQSRRATSSLSNSSHTLSEVEHPEYAQFTAIERLIATGTDPALYKILHSKQPILIVGESGTGKSTIAKLINSHNQKTNGAFVSLHCGTQSMEQIKLELQCLEKSRLLCVAAQKAKSVDSPFSITLLLEEITELTPALQKQLLDLLVHFEDTQSQHKFDDIHQAPEQLWQGNLIATSRIDLEELAKNGHFRDDLYVRLATNMIHVKPLRHRTQELPQLIQCLMEDIAVTSISDATNAKMPVLHKTALDALVVYQWGGNIRELRATLERAIVTSSTDIISPSDLNLNSLNNYLANDFIHLLGGQTLKDVERKAIAETLKLCRGNKAAAARKLGISERSIYNKIKQLDIQ